MADFVSPWIILNDCVSHSPYIHGLMNIGLRAKHIIIITYLFSFTTDIQWRTVFFSFLFFLSFFFFFFLGGEGGDLRRGGGGGGRD